MFVYNNSTNLDAGEGSTALSPWNRRSARSLNVILSTTAFIRCDKQELGGQMHIYICKRYTCKIMWARVIYIRRRYTCKSCTLLIRATVYKVQGSMICYDVLFLLAFRWKIRVTWESVAPLDDTGISSCIYGWLSNRAADGRLAGSLCRHCLTKSCPIGESVSGMGTSREFITLNIAAHWHR